VLPNYIFDLRNECEKEHKQQEKETGVEQNGYQPLLSSQESHETITEESTDVIDDDAIGSEWTMLTRVRRPVTLA